MTIIKLKGGIGNQMFQYAAARGINANSIPIILDVSSLSSNNVTSETFTPRDFELHIFKYLKAKPASRFFINFVLDYKPYYRAIRALLLFKTEKIIQVENEYIEAVKQNRKNVYLDGYFQSEKYFKHIRKSLIQEFIFPPLNSSNNLILEQINACSNSVSIHVRRGDFLKPIVLQYHGILPITYYKASINILKAQVANPHYFIFSNDKEWCEFNFGFLGDNYTLIEPNDSNNAWQEMYLMTQCRHHIVANSSFSWWGAWLSEKQGINLAPYKWFNPKVAKFDINDFVPSSWQIVKYD